MNSMAIEALNCPNCGAGVSGDSTQCPFCKSRLKTVVCPKCFGLMFLGSKFCEHCGAEAVEAVIDEANLGDCPRCRIRLKHLQIEKISLAECEKCSGLWADVATFQRICEERDRQSAVLGFAGQKTVVYEQLSKITYVPCPKCKQLMNRSNFARASGVIIDTCKQHGVWFDADELPKAIDFIQKGGLEITRQRELNDLRIERERLRDEQRRDNLFEQRFGGNSMFNDPTARRARSLFEKLFD